jgi:hypothetical protein
MAKRQDPAVAPDQIHGDGDQAQAQCLAEDLDEAGRDNAEPETFRKNGDHDGEHRQKADEDQHRGLPGKKGAFHG